MSQYTKKQINAALTIMGKIYIEGLEVFSLIGVYDWERLQKQRLLIDVELTTDITSATSSDDIDDTLNYAQIADYLTSLAEQAEYKLLEALVGNMVSGLLKNYPKVKHASIKLSKPDILPNARNVAVELTGEQS